ncbi:MAG: hypothetical protein LBU32_16575 [Clostridiales bacterium]|jgi:hypothetical protein|nr:hypothetical protein [Clostridiales bacterium]
MDLYRSFLTKRQKALQYAILGSLFIWAFIIASFIKPIGGKDFSDFLRGFQIGLMVAVDLSLIRRMLKCRGAMKDEEKLKRIYFEENDERRKMIFDKSGGSAIYFCALALLVAAVISAYFGPAIFYALLGSSVFLLVARKVLMVYYSKKY